MHDDGIRDQSSLDIRIECIVVLAGPADAQRSAGTGGCGKRGSLTVPRRIPVFRRD
jgi:hypothetical protein